MLAWLTPRGSWKKIHPNDLDVFTLIADIDRWILCQTINLYRDSLPPK
jgi:hypothetical protein